MASGLATASAHAEARLQELLNVSRRHCGVVRVELRTVADGGASRLLAAAEVPGLEVPAPLLEDEELRNALACGDTTVLIDRVAGRPTSSWLVVPGDDADSTGGKHVLLGVAETADDIADDALRRVGDAVRATGLLESSAGDRSQDPLVTELANSLPIPILVTDPAGKVVALNDNFTFLYGCVDADPGDPMHRFLPPEHEEVFQDALDSTLRRSATVELPLPALRGALDRLAFTLTTRLLDRGASGTAVIFVLREISAGLELSRLRQMNDLKTELFHGLVHDLKSPLSAMVNGLDMLPATVGDDVPDEGIEILQVVRTSLRRVEELIDDFHELTDLSCRPQEMPLEDMQLEEIIDGLLDVYRLQNLPHRFHLDSAHSAPVRIDRARMSRALDNLISNAVKYSPGGGDVRVVVSGDELGRVCVSISDQGLGIPEEHQSRVWEPFYRPGLPEADEIEGTGLGLSIVRHIINAHGGELSLDSERGKGSTFVVSLPAAEPFADAASEDRPQED